MAAPPITERHLHHFHRRSPIKEPVRVATTANITISTALNNGDSLDGVTLATDDRVLVKDQSTASQNGLYIVGASPARAYDQSTDDPAFGFLVRVSEGTANAGKVFANTNTATPTIGTTGLTFAEVTGSGGGSTFGWFLPETYGAAGDDTTDDTTAFEDAITAAAAADGGVILLSRQYLIPSGLDITDPHIHFWGLGNEYGPAQIRTTTANATALNFSSSWPDASRTYQSSVRDLLIKGAGSASSGSGIRSKSNINLDNVGIQGFYNGVLWDDLTFYSRARGVFVTGCTRGFSLNETNNCTIEECRITGDPLGVSSLDAVTDGIYIVSTFPRGEAIRIVNSSIEYFTGDGIRIDGAVAPLIVGNYFETQQSSSGHAYINLGPGSKVVYAAYIGNNHFDGPGISGFQAIKCDRAEHVTLENNDDTTSFGALTVYLSSTANTTPIVLINNPSYNGGTVTLPANSIQLDPNATTITPSQTGAPAAGSSAYLARADHVHGLGGNNVVLTGTPSSGQVPTATSSSAATWQTPAPTGIGEILISDTPSTPLVFADLIQNEAQTDLVYADP